jgi:hypothetical protein
MEHIVTVLAAQYRGLASQSSQPQTINKMIDKLCESVDSWPTDKTNRWIGFVQGVLYVDGLIDIDTERDFTRPLFHQYYADNGINIPPSVTI